MRASSLCLSFTVWDVEFNFYEWYILKAWPRSIIIQNLNVCAHVYCEKRRLLVSGWICALGSQVWRAIRSLADRVACELSTLRYGSLKPQLSLAADGSAVLVALLRPEGALLGEGEGIQRLPVGRAI